LTRGLRIALVVLVALGALSLSSAALAQENYPPSPPPGEILGEEEGKGTGTGDPDGAVLPFTGGQVVMIVVVGAGLIVLGTMVYRRSRSEAGIA
jgi:hypothetical protein